MELLDSSHLYSYIPRVGRQHPLPLLYYAGIETLIDGVGDYTHVVLIEGQVPRIGVFQELIVLVPAVELEKQRTD